MSRKSRGTQRTGGVKETMEKSQEASQPFATEEQAEPHRSHQYRSNDDPSLYLYGNPPSTLEPYSMAEWNNPNDTQNQYQYGSPVSITGSNVHHASPYYSSNPSPFARAGQDIRQSTSKTAPQTASTMGPKQEVFDEAEQKPVRPVSDDETIRHGQGRGRIEWENGTMVWRELKFDETEEPWQPAVYHDQVRHELILAANCQGNYDFPRESGLAEDDVTSFLHEQKTWQVMDREHRPDILFQWKKAGHRNPTYVVPDWYHRGKIVLDRDNRPVRKFRNIPDTCSSMLEGGIMEAIKREDNRITHQDFVARMLPEILVKTAKRTRLQPLYGKNAMAARMRRFRERACCIVWGIRAGSDEICRYMEAKLPAQCIADNSTRNFRDLYDHEILAIRQLNAGKFSERAGPRAIAEEERISRAQKRDARVERGKQQYDNKKEVKGEAIEKKRKRKAAVKEEEDDEVEASDFTTAKRAIAPRRKQRKIGHATTSEASRNVRSFELGDESDDECLQLYGDGCSNPNASRQGPQTRQTILTDNTEPAFNHTSQFWASAMPPANDTMASFAEHQNAYGQEFYTAGTSHGGLFNASDTTTLSISAVSAVPERPLNDSPNSFTLNEAEDIPNFYESLPENPYTTSIVGAFSVDTSNTAAVNDNFVGFDTLLAEAIAAQDYSNLPSIQWDGLDTLVGQTDGTTSEPTVEPTVEPNLKSNGEESVEPDVEGPDLLDVAETWFEEFVRPYEGEDDAPPS